ncbi:MAG: glycosyltransferase family 2 protein [Flammeovirgaceae bacterium]
MCKVSVIVPNYNHANFLKKRIDSILAQTFTDFELIILDDCSTDNSREIIEYYRKLKENVKIEYNTVNSGSTFKQWDRGISLAEGELIWVAESDDYCEPEFLETCVSKMLNYENVGVVVAQSVEVNEVDGTNLPSFSNNNHFAEIFKNSYFNSGRDEISEKLVYENTIPNASAVLFRKNLYQKCGGTDKTMRLCGDWFLWIKLLLSSNIYYISTPLNYFRFTRTSLGFRLSKKDTFHERVKILKFLHINGFVRKVKLVERNLLITIFNSYKIGEIWEGLRLAYKHREYITYPITNVFLGLTISVGSRIIKRIT